MGGQLSPPFSFYINRGDNMLISTLVQNINSQLAGELLSIHELTVFIDKAIDDVNIRLNTKFPVLSDVIALALNNGAKEFEYNAIPDKYIRTVIVPGAVFKYYTTDEEGAAVAPKYEEEFLKGLFYMERDYLNLVPEEYQDSLDQGWIRGNGILESDEYNKQGGFTIDGSVFQL
jgi:hypothetical protein